MKSIDCFKSTQIGEYNPRWVHSLFIVDKVFPGGALSAMAIERLIALATQSNQRLASTCVCVCEGEFSHPMDKRKVLFTKGKDDTENQKLDIAHLQSSLPRCPSSV